MSTFTSSLPDGLLSRLDSAAKRLNLPKNKLMERALEIYLDQLNRAEYVKSYKLAAQDEEIMAIAEEGMTAYFLTLDTEVAG
jgi:predicted transcriptional regulator